MPAYLRFAAASLIPLLLFFIIIGALAGVDVSQLVGIFFLYGLVYILRFHTSL